VTANLAHLLRTAIGAEAAEAVLGVLSIRRCMLDEHGEAVSRAVFAMALNGVLFHDLLRRVPTGAAYVAELRAAGERIVMDHGALRTVRLPSGPTGDLPAGFLAFARILEPLGYRVAGLYPLDRLGMTGRAFTHLDLPEDIPQFFVSELHVDRFPRDFQAVAARVFGASRDGLDVKARSALDAFARRGACPMDAARDALPALAAAFGRWHPLPTLKDYEALKARSQEAAWIATEGGCFNHATSRVADIVAAAEEQRRMGRPIKDAIEVSASGRVRQTAFRADPVTRRLPEAGGPDVQVPGSFYEIISRARIGGSNAPLDLAFDSANAQGIFGMTRAG
jgi:hypothetical protein